MFDELIRAASSKYGVPESWVRAFIQTESSFDPNAYRAEPRINDASYGLMQLLYGTALYLGYSGPPTGLYDPAINIDLGTKYIAKGRTLYGDDIAAVYSWYNSGSGTKYLTNDNVATHVRHMLDNFYAVLDSQPEAVAATGGGGLLLIVVLFLLLKKKRRQ